MSRIIYQNKEALNTNPAIPNFNKVQADDMNQLKNAINQAGQLFTASTPTTTKFQIDAVGTLSSNDKFTIKFPESAGQEDQAQLSVDGGIQFFNIKDKTVNQVENKILDLLFQNNEFIVINEYSSNNETIKFTPNSNFTITNFKGYKSGKICVVQIDGDLANRVVGYNNIGSLSIAPLFNTLFNWLNNNGINGFANFSSNSNIDVYISDANLSRVTFQLLYLVD